MAERDAHTRTAHTRHSHTAHIHTHTRTPRSGAGRFGFQKEMHALDSLLAGDAAGARNVDLLLGSTKEVEEARARARAGVLVFKRGIRSCEGRRTRRSPHPHSLMWTAHTHTHDHAHTMHTHENATHEKHAHTPCTHTRTPRTIHPPPHTHTHTHAHTQRINEIYRAAKVWRSDVRRGYATIASFRVRAHARLNFEF